MEHGSEIMRREYSENVRNLLSSREADATVRFVESRGISLRNWRMFCLEAGAVDGRKWKQREIAAEYKLTIARVSAILKTIRDRLSGREEGRTRIGLMRERRARWYRILRETPIINATKIEELVSRLRTAPSWGAKEKLGWDYSIGFIVGDRSLRVESISFLRNRSWWGSNDHRYVVFWLVEDVDRTCINVSSVFYEKPLCVRDAYWVFAFDELFWVVDQVVVHKDEKRLVVRLKPAEYVNPEAKGG